MSHDPQGYARGPPPSDTALDIALLLALFARAYTVGGFKAVPALPVAPCSEADVLPLITDLLVVASVRMARDGG